MRVTSSAVAILLVLACRPAGPPEQEAAHRVVTDPIDLDLVVGERPDDRATVTVQRVVDTSVNVCTTNPFFAMRIVEYYTSIIGPGGPYRTCLVTVYSCRGGDALRVESQMLEDCTEMDDLPEFRPPR